MDDWGGRVRDVLFFFFFFFVEAVLSFILVRLGA